MTSTRGIRTEGDRRKETWVSINTTVGAVLAVAVLFAPQPIWAGPPAVCQPLDIGKHQTLPFGKGAFDADEKFPLGQVVPETLRILEDSEDVLVHMETVRRAVVYIHKSQREVDRLGAALQRRIIEAGAKTPQETLGLYWFDLGYAQGALRQMGKKTVNSKKFPVVHCLEKATAQRPKDAAVRFGAALASWGAGPKMVQDRFLGEALKLDDDPSGLLRRNRG